MFSSKPILVVLAVALPSAGADPYLSALAAAVHHFARERNLDHLKAILDRHPELIDVPEPLPARHKPLSTEGYTALDWAARAGDLEVVRYLIARGANVNAADPMGWTPLHLAAREGHLPVVKLLVEHGASPLAKTEAIPERKGAFPGEPALPDGAKAPPPKTYPAIPARPPLDWAIEMKHNRVADYLRSIER
jgi:hypothetical protein